MAVELDARRRHVEAAGDEVAADGGDGNAAAAGA